MLKTFNIYVVTASKNPNIEKECLRVLAEYLEKQGKFNIGYSPQEVSVVLGNA